MSLILIITLSVAIFAAVGAAIHLQNALPSLSGRMNNSAIIDTAGTKLGKAVEAEVLLRPGLNGVFTLADGEGAFAARVLLVRAAERSLDLQYYIWHNDIAGALLFEEVRVAADRGVRVRLLLDDNSTRGLDSTLAALATHPNIDVRLFNPFVFRKLRLFGYLTDFARLNQRMHNKTFTADNQVTITGGRNIGDEYSGSDFSELFVDLDVLVIGPVVRETSADFDRYWVSGSAYPIEYITPPAQSGALAALTAVAALAARKPQTRAYLDAVQRSIIVDELLLRRLAYEWAIVRLVSDDPAKGLGLATDSSLVLNRLNEILLDPKVNVALISAYFVPTKVGVDALTALKANGVAVDILTNALEVTDVMVVHAGYAKSRKRLLQAGIRLFEMRGPIERDGFARRITAFGSTGSGVRGVGSALHAKIFTVDQSRVFVGSFNFDPRSVYLNTEFGLVFESPVLAGLVDAAFDAQIPACAYEVRLAAGGKLSWLEQGECVTIHHSIEPGTSRLQRATVAILSLLPIEWLL